MLTLVVEQLSTIVTVHCGQIHHSVILYVQYGLCTPALQLCSVFSFQTITMDYKEICKTYGLQPLTAVHCNS